MTSLVRWWKRLLMAAGGFLILISCTPVVFWWATALAGAWDDPKGDVLIVLTGSGMEDGIIGENSYWRAIYAIRAYQAHECSEILITGGGGEQPPTAATMRKFLLAHGIPDAAIRIEVASLSTFESAVNVARLLAADPDHYAQRKLVLLTSDYHMYRSNRVFEQAGVRALPRPIPDIRKRYGGMMNRWGLFGELSLESAKIVYYKLRGWI